MSHVPDDNPATYMQVDFHSSLYQRHQRQRQLKPALRGPHLSVVERTARPVMSAEEGDRVSWLMGSRWVVTSRWCVWAVLGAIEDDETRWAQRCGQGREEADLNGGTGQTALVVLQIDMVGLVGNIFSYFNFSSIDLEMYVPSHVFKIQ
jgi:hypothetical protein